MAPRIPLGHGPHVSSQQGPRRGVIIHNTPRTVLRVLRNRSTGLGPSRDSARRPEKRALSFFTLYIKQLFGTTDPESAERRRMIERTDYDEVERLETELDRFVEKRAREKAEANRTEEFWVEQERRHRERRRAANRKLWIDSYGSMHRVHLGIAEGHARRRAQLMAEGGYELDETPDPEVA
jgi:hypothetical protein